jgi:hypothetical protein
MHKVRDNYSSCRVGAVKIYVAADGELRKKMKDGVKTRSNSVWHKKWCISEFDTPFKANVFLEPHPVLDQTQATGAVLSGLYGILYQVTSYLVIYSLFVSC